MSMNRKEQPPMTKPREKTREALSRFLGLHWRVRSVKFCWFFKSMLWMRMSRTDEYESWWCWLENRPISTFVFLLTVKQLTHWKTWKVSNKKQRKGRNISLQRCFTEYCQTQKLRRSKQRIALSPRVRMPEKYSDLRKKSVDFVPVLW